MLIFGSIFTPFCSRIFTPALYWRGKIFGIHTFVWISTSHSTHRTLFYFLAFNGGLLRCSGLAPLVSQIIKVSSFLVFCWMQMTLKLTLSKNFTHTCFIAFYQCFSIYNWYSQIKVWWFLWSHSIVNMGKTRCRRYFLIMPLSDVKINDRSWCKLQSQGPSNQRSWDRAIYEAEIQLQIELRGDPAPRSEIYKLIRCIRNIVTTLGRESRHSCGHFMIPGLVTRNIYCQFLIFPQAISWSYAFITSYPHAYCCVRIRLLIREMFMSPK